MTPPQPDPLLRPLDDPPSGADVVVIGGGMVGAATALHAARAGLRPLVLERRPAAATLTTAVAAGGYRLQLDTPEELALVRESVELFERFADATGQRAFDPALRRQGYLWVTLDEAGAARQRDLVERQRSWGLDDVEVMDGDEARRAFSFLSPDVVHARFRQADGLLDPRSVALGLLAGACLAGGALLTRCEVTGLRVRGGRVTGVQTSRGVVGADAVVVAAGPFSGLVASGAGVHLPVSAVTRHKVVMPDVPEVPPGAPMTIDDDTGAHWRPLFGGAALLFTDPATAPSPPADDVPLDHRFAFALLDPDSPVALARVTPFWRRVWERGSASWLLQAGQYTMTPDHRPLIGPVGPEGLFVNTGYSGHGIMASPTGSRLLVDALTGSTRGVDPFRPDRRFGPPPAGTL